MRKLLLTHRKIVVYRVHWLKAKSRRDRWREEQVLLASEMEWTEIFFRHRASCWKTVATESSAFTIPSSIPSEPESSQGVSEVPTSHSKGHICYALKLESMCNRLAQQAAARFSVAKAGIPLQRLPRTKSASNSLSEQSF